MRKHKGKKPRRDREVKGMVATGATLKIELINDATKTVISIWVVKVAGNKSNTLGKLLPGLLPKWSSAVLSNRVVHNLGEVLIRPIPASESDECEARRQESTIC